MNLLLQEVYQRYRRPLLIGETSHVGVGRADWIQEITDEVWPAYKKSLENTIMQFETFKKAIKTQVPMLFVNGIFDLFIIRGNIRDIRRANKRYVRVKRVLGPHELTPRQGKTVARILGSLVK